MRPDKLPVTEIVVGILARTPMTRRQLAARLGKDPHPTLVRLMRAGRVESVANDTDAMTQARVYRVRETRANMEGTR